MHDIGWSQISKEESLKIFSSETGEEDRIKIQRKHEEAGTKLAKQILDNVNYNTEAINEILEIISKHDTRKGFISKNEGIMRDADKLWRFSKRGFWADIKRRNNTPKEECDKLKAKIDSQNFFYSDSAKKMAREELEKRRSEFLYEKSESTNL